MGADIHAYVESTGESGLRHVVRFEMNRDYVVFELLAGVRMGAVHACVYQAITNGEIPTLTKNDPITDYIVQAYYCADPQPLIPPRGVPEDAHRRYKAAITAYEGDAHSATWLSLDDMRSVQSLHTAIPRRMPRPDFQQRFAVCKESTQSAAEFGDCLNDCSHTIRAPNADLTHLIATMESLTEPRFLCFFDN